MKKYESQTHGPERKGTVKLIQSSHHDLGWHKDDYGAEAQFAWDEINYALDQMAIDPEFTFCHECCVFIRGYLRKYPQRGEELAARIREKRFELGAGYCMPYTAFVTQEMLIRNLILGKGWAEAAFPGCRAGVYYNTDVPSLTTQMPQILNQSGVEYLYASRSWDFPGFGINEFKYMEAPDGTQTPVHFMHHYGDCLELDGYGHILGCKADSAEFIQDLVGKQEEISRQQKLGPALPVLLSMDCRMPEDCGPRIQRWNQYAEENGLPAMEYGTLQQTLDQVFQPESEPEVLRGEWPNKWFYENEASSQRIFSMQKDAERNLRMAETLAVFRGISTGDFQDYPAGKIDEIWQDVCFSCHGFAPESPIHQFETTYRRALEESGQLCRELLHWLENSVAADPGKGLPLIVYNPLPFSREDTVSFIPPAEGNFRILDALGQEMLCQKTREGSLLLQTGVIPAFGWRVYYLQQQERLSGEKTPFPVGEVWDSPVENQYYRVVPLKTGGGLNGLEDLTAGGQPLFCCDKFRIGELYDFRYDGMGAGEQLHMWQPYDGCSQAKAFAPWICVESGPVRTVWESRAQTTSRGPAVLRFTLFGAMKRADLDLDLEMDDAPAHQLRLMFPIAGASMFGPNGQPDPSGTVVRYQVPFGDVRMGEEILPQFSSWNPNTGDPNHVGNGTARPEDYPGNSAVRPREVQDWIRAGTENLTVCFSSGGLGWDYQDPTENPVATPVLQPILLSSSKSCHPRYGHWLQPGHHSFHFSITSGPEDPALSRNAAADRCPLIPRLCRNPGSLLPEQPEGLTVSRDNVTVTALKKEEGAGNRLVLRWYETEGNPQGTVTFTIPGCRILSALPADLLERETAAPAYPAAGSSFTAPVHPHGIQTALLTVERLK